MQYKYVFLWTILVYITLGAKNYYVTPSGKSSNTGTSFTTSMDIVTALSKAAAGDSILLQGGTYILSYVSGTKNTLICSKSGTANQNIYIGTTQNAKAIFDFSFAPQDYLQDCWGFSLTGSYWYFKGVHITRAGYQGIYVTGAYNTFDNCSFYENRNSGIEINKGGSYTTVLHCDSYKNYDPKKLGSMADGFASKQTQGAGNKFIDCRAWNNSDDGYDTFDSDQVVTFDNCWAFNNGIDIWNYGGFTGNGNGFKAGGNAQIERNVLTRCVSFGNPSKGFDQNNNAGGVTLYNCTAYNNGINFGFGGAVSTGEKHTLKNNISLGAIATIANATQSNNSWSSGFSVSAADFQSLDLTQATIARSVDGSIPNTTLFRLKSSSALIDAGVNVGLPFNGPKPDLGAFETGTVITSVEDISNITDAQERAIWVSLDPSQHTFMVHSEKAQTFEVYTQQGLKLETVDPFVSFGANYKEGMYLIKAIGSTRVLKVIKP